MENKNIEEMNLTELKLAVFELQRNKGRIESALQAFWQRINKIENDEASKKLKETKENPVIPPETQNAVENNGVPIN